MRRKTSYLFFILVVVSLITAGNVFRFFLESLPATQLLEGYLPHLTTRIYDYKENLILELFTEHRVWVPLNQIPVDLQNAFIAVEDDRFFSHWGISLRGTLRAAVKNFMAGRVVQGGSTITQQLSKLIFLTQEKTFSRKAKEFFLSLQIERKFSKEEILQIYLNQIYFGQGVYGVSAASKIYFGKRVQELTLSECALLAGIPRLPNYYSPFNHPERALHRRSVVLSRMRQLKFISEEEEKLARSSPLGTKKFQVLESFASYFMEHIRQNMEAKYGSDLLYRGGLSIYTTLNTEMQNAAEQVMGSALEKFDKEYGIQAEGIRTKLKMEEMKKNGKYSKNFSVKSSTTITKVQGALLVLDTKTGAIRTMIGGRNFSESQFNRAIQAKRQPGSTFKPFVWGAALESGFTAASVVEDLPIAFFNDGHDWRLIEGATDFFSIQQATTSLALTEDQLWIPKNYDGRYLGPVTLRKGLALSRNLVSVRLIDFLNPRKVMEWAQKMGIKSSLDPTLSLSLGTSVVTLLELVSAFGTIAAEGVRTEPYAITKVTDFEGKVLEENFPQETEVISPQLNYLITSLLKSVITEGTALSARSLGRSVAGKTGTSQDQRDLWFVGFTPDLVCGSWMGYDDFSPLGKKLAAGGVLVPWWTEFMKKVLEEMPVKGFTVPEGITFVSIDRFSGALPLSNCPETISEAFKVGSEPKEFCSMDHSVKSAAETEVEE